MKNHEENFDKLHMENEDADLVGAYNSAIAIPDMWDRISAGFDVELENIKSETLSKGDAGADAKRQGKMVVKTEVSEDDKNYKRFSHYKSWMGLVAAMLLVCIIAIPLIRSGVIRNRKTDNVQKAYVDESYADDEMEEEPYNDVESAAESYDDVEESAAESYDDVEESAGEAYDTATNKAAGAYDSAVQDTDSAASDVTVASEYAADETVTDFEAEVSGSITRSGDEYILTVTAVLNTENSDYAISENDSIKLDGASAGLNLKDGETVTYDSIRLNNFEPITEEDVANTGYKISYTAEVVLIQ